MVKTQDRARKSSNSSDDSESTWPKSRGLSILRKICPTKSRSSGPEHRQKSTSSRVHSPPLSSPLPTRLVSLSGVQESIPDAVIASDFAALHDLITQHVSKYYSKEQLEITPTRSAIEHATTGLAIPWPQIVKILTDVDSRFGALALCIGWTILSRSLLLKSGLSNSPGSTFLPPEVVECFQSFSLGSGARVLDAESPEAKVNFALLSRWKRISATLMHSTYVKYAFSHFDSRTVNIERALHDLDALLRIYAVPNDAGHGKGTRVAELRELLRGGAGFAFMLFGQPSFWHFDWAPGSEQMDGPFFNGGATHNTFQLDRGQSNDTAGTAAEEPSELVIWPTLLRVMDGEGRKLDLCRENQKDCLIFGTKIYLSDFEIT